MELAYAIKIQPTQINIKYATIKQAKYKDASALE